MKFLRLAFLLAVAPLLRAELAPSATAVHPLQVGQAAPAVVLRTPEGRDFGLGAALAERPTLVIFYRGSWCPYCNRHLAALAGIEPELLRLGVRILAVSPDEAAGLRTMAEKNHLNFQLLSDREMKAASAFGVAFRVDTPTVEKYRGYKVELTPVPGEPAARWLPVPAAFLIGRDGRVRFMHADADYTRRVPTDELLAAARALAAQ